MPFDTERFIKEIQSRPCLWNKNSKFSNIATRQTAWNEIAEILINDWEQLEDNIKAKRVYDLQKKWKGLRDYYIRENHKVNLRSGGGILRKRKAPLFNMLNFLSITKDTGPPYQSITSSTTTSTEDIRYNGSDREESQTSASAKSRNMSTFQESFNSMENKRENDPDMNFLLTILPEMKSMTPSQNFDFRFEVMRVIKNMKYSNSNCNSGSCSSEQHVCNIPYHHDYMSGAGLSSAENCAEDNALAMTENSSNNSMAFVIEDIKPIIFKNPNDTHTD